MSIKATILGLGGAGGKSAIRLIERKVVDRDHVHILNTSSLDVPEEYKNDQSTFTTFGMYNGSGKESAKGRAAMIKAIQDNQIDLEGMINDDSQEIVLVCSGSGGTGSGSVPVLARYFDSMGIPVHVFVFIGFDDDTRSINNTLKFFKELPDNVILHTIMNSHFLDYTKNYAKAEQAANDEFTNQVEILLGNKLVIGKQVLDQYDQFKINTQPGYMVITHIPLDGIKNTDGFNACVAKAFENPSWLDNDLSSKRIAVIINATSRVKDVIDNSFEVIKRYVGVPIEVFTHIQGLSDEEIVEDYIEVLVTGMNYPEKPIRDLSLKYNRLKEKLNMARNSFTDIYENIDLDDDMNEFNTDVKRKGKAKSVSELFGSELSNADATPSSRPAPKQEKVQVKEEKSELKSSVQPEPLKTLEVESTPELKNPIDPKNVPIETKDLKSHQFVNTTVDQTIYGPQYDEMEVDDDESSYEEA